MFGRIRAEVSNTLFRITVASNEAERSGEARLGLLMQVVRGWRKEWEMWRICTVCPSMRLGPASWGREAGSVSWDACPFKGAC